LVDRREKGFKGWVLKYSDEERTARMGAKAGGLESEPVSGVGGKGRGGRGVGGGSGARADGIDDRLCFSDRDVTFAAFDEDETEEVGAGFGCDKGCFGGLQAADLDEGGGGGCGCSDDGFCGSGLLRIGRCVDGGRGGGLRRT
jgi:hypothetical protein